MVWVAECHNEFVWVKHRISPITLHLHLKWVNKLGQWLPTHRIYHLPAVTANHSSGATSTVLIDMGWSKAQIAVGCCWSPQGSLLDVLGSRDCFGKVRFTVDLIFFEWFWFSIYIEIYCRIVYTYIAVFEQDSKLNRHKRQVYQRNLFFQTTYSGLQIWVCTSTLMR